MPMKLRKFVLFFKILGYDNYFRPSRLDVIFPGQPGKFWAPCCPVGFVMLWPNNYINFAVSQISVFDQNLGFAFKTRLNCQK